MASSPQSLLKLAGEGNGTLRLLLSPRSVQAKRLIHSSALGFSLNLRTPPMPLFSPSTQARASPKLLSVTSNSIFSFFFSHSSRFASLFLFFRLLFLRQSAVLYSVYFGPGRPIEVVLDNRKLMAVEQRVPLAQTNLVGLALALCQRRRWKSSQAAYATPRLFACSNGAQSYRSMAIHALWSRFRELRRGQLPAKSRVA